MSGPVDGTGQPRPAPARAGGPAPGAPVPAADALDAQQFRLFAEYLPTPCWIAGGDGALLWCNERWHDYSGTTPGAVAGTGWQRVHHPDHLPAVVRTWAAAIATGEPFEMVVPLRGADGAFRPFLSRVAPLRDAGGAVVRWFGVDTEVGAQPQGEASTTVLTDAMPQMVWATRPDGYHDYYNARWYAFTGTPPGSTDGEGWNGMFHPDDQERAWARWRRSLSTGEPYEIEYRLRHRDGDYRWVLGRAMPVRDEAGRITRWIGTCTDIHDAKLAAARNEVLSRELSHRIKNIFAIIAGLVRLSARRDPAAKGFARDLLDRIAALGRAHEFARPHSEISRPEVVAITLQGLLRDLFSPYAEGAARIGVEGDDAPVDDKGATPVALLFHELATNAVKYGALSVPEGRVAVRVAVAGEGVTVTWVEAGGPAVSGPPHHEGFGTKLAAMSVEQLGGTIDRDWHPDGLRATLRLPGAHLTRS